MYRGGKLIEVARHVTLYGVSSTSNKFVEARFDKPSWRILFMVSQRFKDRDLYTQSRFHDTLNHKYPSVGAFTTVLEVLLVGDIKPKMKLKAFKFDEVRPKLVASDFKHIMTGIKRKPPPKKIGLYHI